MVFLSGNQIKLCLKAILPFPYAVAKSGYASVISNMVCLMLRKIIPGQMKAGRLLRANAKMVFRLLFVGVARACLSTLALSAFGGN